MSLTRDNKTNPLLGEYNADFAAKIRDNLGGVNGLWPIELGGTGASDAAAALEALGLPYEVGTWEPFFTSVYPGSQAVQGTFTNTQGIFVKIGKLVYVSARVVGPAITSPGDGYGCAFGGLPYTAKERSLVAGADLQLKVLLATSSAFLPSVNRDMLAITSGLLSDVWAVGSYSHTLSMSALYMTT